MSCLVYNHDEPITDWLHRNGIFSDFIHRNVNTLIDFLELSHIDYTVAIDTTVRISAGIPLITIFDISGNKVSCKTLGTLTSTVDAWDLLTDKVPMSQLIENSGIRTAVFATSTEQGS